jgi:hypothetical protein
MYLLARKPFTGERVMVDSRVGEECRVKRGSLLIRSRRIAYALLLLLLLLLLL